MSSNIKGVFFGSSAPHSSSLDELMEDPISLEDSPISSSVNSVREAAASYSMFEQRSPRRSDSTTSSSSSADRFSLAGSPAILEEIDESAPVTGVKRLSDTTIEKTGKQARLLSATPGSEQPKPPTILSILCLRREPREDEKSESPEIRALSNSLQRVYFKPKRTQS